MDVSRSNILSILSEQIGVEEEWLTENKALASFGLSSLDKLDLIFSLEDRLGIDLPDDFEPRTVGELIRGCEEAVLVGK